MSSTSPQPDDQATIPDAPAMSLGAGTVGQSRRGGSPTLTDTLARLGERVGSLERGQRLLSIFIALILLFLVENLAVVCFILGHVWR